MTPPLPSDQQILAGILMLLRIGTIMVFIPVLGHQAVPAQIKVGFIVTVMVVVFPVVLPQIPPVPADPLLYALLGVQELLLAGMLSLFARLIFTSVQFAGQIMSYQVGMAVANVFDPSTQAQGAITGQFASVLAILLWLATDTHLLFLKAMIDSFVLIPPGQPWHFAGWEMLSGAVATMFALAVKLVAPVMILVFFVYVALGLISRAVPQIQVFFISFPITIGLGFFVFAVALPAFIHLVQGGFTGLGESLPLFMRKLAGQ
ncbi:MAG: flagellar biosynthetic protein FliR [Zetaproteobacteria bacterium]|nr:MAG: flagellar biosynthetic protein FliR [Zetaproteobacteria bacterium]